MHSRLLFVSSVAHERQAEQQQAAAAPEASSSTAPKPGVLEFDDTSEFVRSITYTPAAPIAPTKQEPIIVKIDTSAAAAAGDDSDDDERGDVAITEMDADIRVKQEDADEDLEMGEDETSAMLNAIADAIKSSDVNGSDTVKAEQSEEQDATPVSPSSSSAIITRRSQLIPSTVSSND